MHMHVFAFDIAAERDLTFLNVCGRDVNLAPSPPSLKVSLLSHLLAVKAV